VKLLLSLLILASGIAVGLTYFRAAAMKKRGAPGSVGGYRPWRKLGAAICLVLAVMFVGGVYLLEPKNSPKVFLTYWAIMLVLVVWLFALAFKDLLHTRRALLALRKEIKRARQSSSNPDGSARNKKA
jgi:phosphatidylglycerophosphate synthase